MRPDLFLATIGRGSNGSNALEVTEDRAAVTAESQDNIINRVNNVSQYNPSWHYVPGIGVAGTAYAEVPGTALGDLAFTRASSKTRTNGSGLVEIIGNNVPPHDYRNSNGTLSTFPRLNLEPQRTNLLLRSQEFDNSAWVKDRTTATSNVTTAPDGTTTADKVVDTLQGNNAYRIYNGITLSAISYSASFYVKAAEYSWVYIRIGNSLRVWFNVSTGAVGNNDFGITGRIESAGNGWFRCTAIIATATAGGGFSLLGLTNANGAETYTPSTGGQGVFVWGAQLEAGGNQTSYIPTTTAAVTRLVDDASKTAISSIIGQTEGTVFLDFEGGANDSANHFLGLSDGTTGNRIVIARSSSNTLYSQIRVAGVEQALIQTGTLTANTRYKCAVAYKLNDIAFYVNGVLVGTDTAATIPATSVFATNTGISSSFFERAINETAIFKTRLTNAQLAQLTTL